MSEQQPHVTLGLAGEIYALPVSQVQEILEMREIALLPQAPDDILGMIDVRGDTVPIVDLRLSLGMARAEDSEMTRIVVTIIDGHRIGIRADRVFEVTTLDDDKLEPAPEIGREWLSHCIAGVGRRNGNFVTVLDFARLLRGRTELNSLLQAA